MMKLRPTTGLCVGQKGRAFTARQYFPFRDYPCVVNTTRISAELEWKPRFTFDEGFRQTLDTYDRTSLQTRPLDTETEDQILAVFPPTLQV